MDRQKAISVLTKFINQIDTQDNRGTATPIMYLLQKQQSIWGKDLNQCDVVKYALPAYDYYDYDSAEAIIESMKENGWEQSEIDAKKSQIVSYEGQHYWHTEQAFLTKSALETHRKINGHNLRGPHQDYVIHAFRDPELMELYDAIRVITLAE